MRQRHQSQEESAVYHLRRLMSEVARGRLGAYLSSLHAAEVAAALARLEPDERETVWQVLSLNHSARVLELCDSEIQQEFLTTKEVGYVSKIISNIAPDDAADILGDAEEETRKAILKELPEMNARRIRQLLKYDEFSAGGIMSTDYLSFPHTWTAGQARNHLRENQPSRLYYNLYVVDDDGHLLGWTTWQQLCLADGSMVLVDLIPPKCPSVPVDMPQEDVANVVTSYDLTAVPVIDVEGKLVGTVTFDDIMDVIEEEANEDILLQAGSREEELHQPTVLKSVGARVPWLSWTFVGGFISFMFLSFFERNLIVLAPFIPITMAMGGNVGLQTATVAVRRLSKGSLDTVGLPSALWREMRVGLSVGMFFGLMLALGAGFYLHTYDVVLVAGLSMLSAATLSAMTGFLIPLLFHRLRIDPALASGPFVTSINDFLTLVMFFTLAHFLLQDLQPETTAQLSQSFHYGSWISSQP